MGCLFFRREIGILRLRSAFLACVVCSSARTWAHSKVGFLVTVLLLFTQYDRNCFHGAKLIGRACLYDVLAISVALCHDRLTALCLVQINARLMFRMCVNISKH